MGIVASARRRVGALIGGFAFEAANATRRLRHFPTTTAHVNVKLASAGQSMIARARYLALDAKIGRHAILETKNWKSAITDEACMMRTPKSVV